MSRVVYAAPALRWTQREEHKLNALDLQTIKRVVGLPGHTSNEMLSLSIHNLLSELIEAQGAAQVIRLSSCRSGMHILESVGAAR
ncbi:hypothetical protein HPB50_014937 [Hyalomma asiaticum]|uniref:Uncharacterized protein n=1 Tax=Hyalomma asiaticum TaxID=266040 RepID=A0ACB7RP97_HYAAI|nr:hypothetical protein HPB50_014937 [Hyalomma asiaticum]